MKKPKWIECKKCHIMFSDKKCPMCEAWQIFRDAFTLAQQYSYLHYGPDESDDGKLAKFFLKKYQNKMNDIDGINLTCVECKKECFMSKKYLYFVIQHNLCTECYYKELKTGKIKRTDKGEVRNKNV